MQDLSYVGEKLRTLRLKRGLTLAEVGEAVGRSASLIGAVERTDRFPSLYSLIELAEFYQVPLVFLFDNDISEYQQDLANRLTEILAERKISIAEVAKRTEINYFELADFFKGRKKLSLNQLKIITNFIDIPLKKLIPNTARYIRHIQNYLDALGLDKASIQNILEYIDSKFEL